MRRLYSSLILIGLAVALGFLNRDTLRDTISAGRDVSLTYLVALAAIACALVWARGALVAATIPGLSIPRAALADQVALSAAYGIAVGGGPVGVAAKITMFRHWNISQSAIGASLVATAVIPTFTTWGPAIGVHIPMMFQGDASRIETLAVVVGIATIAFNIVFGAVFSISMDLFTTLLRFHNRYNALRGALRPLVGQKLPARFAPLTRRRLFTALDKTYAP